MAFLGQGSNDAPQALSRDINVGWYAAPITTVEESTRDLLEHYAHIPPDKVIPRLVETRDKIWQVFPFPCVGQFRFVDLHLHRQKSYENILNSIKDGARFIDIGCCFAQDMRRMVLHGAPSSNMYGIELHGGFIDLAYDFFGDRTTLATHFLVGDLMDHSGEALRDIEGTVDIANLGMVLHLWGLEGQIQFCERVVQFMRPAAGAMIVGHSAGRVEASEWFNPVGKTMFKHNVESFAEMWDAISRRTGTSWKASSWLTLPPEESRHWDDPLARKLMFEVQRL